MKYKYIKGSVEEREEWVFNLFDYVTNSQDSWIARTAYKSIYTGLKENMINSYLNNRDHKLHKYLRKLLNMKLIKPELLDYVLVSSLTREYFEHIFKQMFDGSIVLGVAFPWLYPGTENKTGAESVHQIFIWDIEEWLERRSKWYYKLFFGKPDFIPLDPEISMMGLIYHELIHARQQIIDGKRNPPRRKDGTINYKNYLEIDAYSNQFLLEEQLLGEPYYLKKFNAKTHEEAAKKYLDLLTKGQ